jgi:hypothetical protein
MILSHRRYAQKVLFLSCTLKALPAPQYRGAVSGAGPRIAREAVQEESDRSGHRLTPPCPFHRSAAARAHPACRWDRFRSAGRVQEETGDDCETPCRACQCWSGSHARVFLRLLKFCVMAQHRFRAGRVSRAVGHQSPAGINSGSPHWSGPGHKAPCSFGKYGRQARFRKL